MIEMKNSIIDSYKLCTSTCHMINQNWQNTFLLIITIK